MGYTCPTPKSRETLTEDDISEVVHEVPQSEASAVSSLRGPHQISLAQALEVLPSAGSALHSEGGCKPCVFFHTKGCTREAECQFCHLCEKDTIKKQRKAKRDTLRKAAWEAQQRSLIDASQV